MIKESASRDTGWLFLIKVLDEEKNSFNSQKLLLIIKILYSLMSFATYYLHLIFSRIPSLVSSDLILYVVPILTVSILIFSFKIMFFNAPKLRKVK